ncbi:MAG: hypothetical protein ACI9R3_000299 [Verrucomicrobiales bacterium]|jgi:hypothetical protein
MFVKIRFYRFQAVYTFGNITGAPLFNSSFLRRHLYMRFSDGKGVTKSEVFSDC